MLPDDLVMNHIRLLYEEKNVDLRILKESLQV